MSIKKRKGVISFSNIPTEIVSDEILKEIFSRFYPTHIEHNFNRIRYYGYSRYFEISEEGSVLNEYVIEIEENKEGLFQGIKFNKI